MIRHFTDSIAGYHALIIVQLIILSCLLLYLDEELKLPARITLAASALILPSFVTSFTGLVFPERNVVFWLAWLILFLKLFERSRSTAWAVGAALSAQILVYYKETGCVFLLGLAVARLALRCWDAARGAWKFDRLRDKESRLDFCFVTIALLFLLYYVAAMIPHVSGQYAAQYHYSTAAVFLYYLRLDLLAWLLVGVVLRRAYLIMRGKLVPSLFWDGLSCGAVVLFGAYLCLRLTASYYLASVDLIAILFIGRFSILFSGERCALGPRLPC